MIQKNERFIKIQRLSRAHNSAWHPRPTTSAPNGTECAELSIAASASLPRHTVLDQSPQQTLHRIAGSTVPVISTASQRLARLQVKTAVRGGGSRSTAVDQRPVVGIGCALGSGTAWGTKNSVCVRTVVYANSHIACAAYCMQHTHSGTTTKHTCQQTAIGAAAKPRLPDQPPLAPPFSPPLPSPQPKLYSAMHQSPSHLPESTGPMPMLGL